jgi:hypothetical protein
LVPPLFFFFFFFSIYGFFRVVPWLNLAILLVIDDRARELSWSIG